MVEKILENATELFVQQGFKVVTMDDIASSMGISKKTIYQYYENKNILVEKSAQHVARKISAEIDQIYSEQGNPIEEILLVKNKIAHFFSNEKTAGVQQLKKYYPEIHNRIKDTQRSKMEVYARNNIERGIKLGLFRDDLDISFTIKLNHNAVSFILDENELSDTEKGFNYYQNTYIDYHIRAIGTEKGIKLLNELKQKLHEK